MCIDNFNSFPVLQSIFVYHRSVKSKYLIRVANELSSKLVLVTMMNQDILIGVRSSEEQISYANKTNVKLTTLMLKHCDSTITKCKEGLIKLVEHSSQNLNNIWIYDSLNVKASALEFLRSLEYVITVVKVLDVQGNQLAKQVVDSLANIIIKYKQCQITGTTSKL